MFINQVSLVILVVAILLSVGMQAYSVNRIVTFIRNRRGVIRSRIDLAELKEVINLNMKLAVVYIVLYVVFFILIVLMFVGGWASQAILIMFLFGIITLPVGLIGKHYENKIKSLRIESDDKEIERIFDTYLVQWKQARWKLPD
ncbi:MAG: hypothetical protein ABIL22_04540 [candidate division WOR-3 bacterium]